MDGLIYASIGQNLAKDIGSFWLPHFSESLFPQYFEHPSLALWIQSYFHKVFGNWFLTENIYCAFIFILSTIGLGRIAIISRIKDIILPNILWIITPIAFWAIPNNMLESTMTLFLIWSTYFLMLHLRSNVFMSIQLILSGLLLLCAFLSKGLPAAFILAIPLFWKIVSPSYSIKKLLVAGVVLTICSVGVLTALYFIHEPAKIWLETYYENQLVRSISGNRMTTHRSYILGRLFQELIPMVLALLCAYFAFGRNKPKKIEKRYAVFFVSIGLAASIPIMISPKQSAFYLVPCIPFFALGIAHLIGIKTTWPKQWKTGIFAILILVTLAGLGYGIFNYGKYSRDHDLQEDIENFMKVSASPKIVDSSVELRKNWSLHGYLKRYYDCTLLTNSGTSKFLLTRPGESVESLEYEPIEIKGITKFKVYKRVQ